MASSVLVTFLKQIAIDLEWAVGVECLAEFHCNGRVADNSIYAGMEAGIFAVRDGFGFSEQSFC